jgi:hypothetical protein
MPGRPLLRRFASAALVAALGVPVAGAPASAADKRGGEPGFAVAAVGFESYFRYKLRPSEVQRGRLRLISRSKRDERVQLMPADVATAANGGLEYGSEAPRSYGRWISIARRVTVPAGAAVEVPFSVRPDGSVGPGDHFAGIVAINRRDIEDAQREEVEDGFSLRYLPRLAMTVQVTVPGRATTELSAGGLAIDVTPSGTAVNVLLRNTGEKLIEKTTGSLVLRHGDGRTLLERDVEIGAFVPQTTIAYRLPLTGRPAEGRYRVVGRLRPEGAETVVIDDEVAFAEKEADELRSETGREAAGGTPTWLFIVLGGAAVLVLALAYALLTTRRRLAARSD